MRDAAAAAWIRLFMRRPFVFLTGDLGFGALEPLREVMGDRFVNAGLAEQNMVSVAAGLASRGLDVWAYSIGPFCYARPFEQIRNDVCQHGLPVRLIGNGGGFAYGTMGASHHALEDYGILLTLPGMRVHVPAFAEDVPTAIESMAARAGPAYLRLGRDERPAGLAVPAGAPWRRLAPGPGPVAVFVGPLVGGLLGALESLPPGERPDVWSLSELPIDDLPAEFLASLRERDALLVVEEHVAAGSAGSMLAARLLAVGAAPRSFDHACAATAVVERCGSPAFHRRACGLDVASLLERVHRLGSGR